MLKIDYDRARSETERSFGTLLLYSGQEIMFTQTKLITIKVVKQKGQIWLYSVYNSIFSETGYGTWETVSQQWLIKFLPGKIAKKEFPFSDVRKTPWGIGIDVCGKIQSSLWWDLNLICLFDIWVEMWRRQLGCVFLVQKRGKRHLDWRFIFGSHESRVYISLDETIKKEKKCGIYTKNKVMETSMNKQGRPWGSKQWCELRQKNMVFWKVSEKRYMKERVINHVKCWW